MDVLRLRCFWYVLVLAVHVSETTDVNTGSKQTHDTDVVPDTTPEDNSVSPQTSKEPSDPSPPSSAGPEPGDPADSFSVPTLDGEFSWEPGKLEPASSLFIHAFTNKSGFLECLWSSEESLKSLVVDLPDSAELLVLSLDDSAVTDALWMQEQVQRSAATYSKMEVLSRIHFCPIPVFALGNWIPKVLYYWSSSGQTGLSQVVFKSEGWKIPIIVKRLDARYDWLSRRWEKKSYLLSDAGNGCDPSSSVAGAVAWVSEGGCSFFTKVQNMALSNASGVLVHTLPGEPLQDMNCVKDECDQTLNISAAMLHLEPSVVQALRSGQKVNVSFQRTPSPNLFFSIDQQGALAEIGLFLYPSFSFISWQAQWFDFSTDLQIKLRSPAEVIPVFDKVLMKGKKGAVATVQLPLDALIDTWELDVSLSCPGRRDSTCAHWDHTVQLFVCCDSHSPYCNIELGRWITAFRRGIGHWLTDVSPLLPLLDGDTCTFTMKSAWWEMPWLASLNLRFSISAERAGNSVEKLRPFHVTSLYNGGTFDRNYNKRFQPIKFDILASAKKVELFAVITAHGYDNNKCGEFCVTSHHFVVNERLNNTLLFGSAGSPLGCTNLVKDGAVPNEYGTWLYGRGGWCDGLQVDPWRIDITAQLDMSGSTSNTIVYYGLFDGRDPNPSQDPGYIIMSSFLVYYK